MVIARVSIPLVLFAALLGCAAIPPEAPELSSQLGSRISAVEMAHSRLLTDFFNEKRRRVDEFIQQQWVPVFAGEFFNDPKIESRWDQLVTGNDSNERLKFIVLVGSKLQAKINTKRVELIQPLDELERSVVLKLKAEYDNMRAINNTLTAFLHSASKLEENRKRYLEIVGISEKRTEDFINETDRAVSTLVDAAHVDGKLDAEEFKEKIAELIKKLRG